MKKKSARNIVITGASGDLAQSLIKKLDQDHLFLLSRTLGLPEFPEEIDILIHTAGFAIFERLEDLKVEDIEDMFAVNVLSAIKLTQQLKPKKLVNIASIAGKIPTEKSNVYAASKAALIHFGEAMRFEGVEVLNVNTGPVRTKFHSENSNYLQKMGKYVLEVDYLAQKIVDNLEGKRRELTLPWQMMFLDKLRVVFPRTIDYLGQRFFNYK
ncbi:MAG: SDR family NAD(P)-dependent oxidoreductase [Lactovum sp.]